MGNQGDRKRMSAAYSYALTRLTLNYYGFCLDLAEDQNPSLYGHELVGQVHRLLAEYLNGVSILEKLKMFRERIRKEMEVLTSYADCFQIYEYAVNRLERRFEEKPELPDDALFVKQFCNYLSDAQDSQVLYFRLQMMLEQLPIRLTKAKFFSLLMEGLSLYQDAGRSSLDQRLYMLRSGSMIGLPESMKDGHEAMYQDLKFLEQLDFKALTEQTYHQAAQMIREHAETLTNETYFLEPVQDLINDLYVLCLTRDSAIRDAGEEAAITQILLQMSHACSEGGNSLHALEELEETLYLLEGKQELYYERFLNAPFLKMKPRDRSRSFCRILPLLLLKPRKRTTIR
ncbi:MAG: hypothetical protein ACLTKI_06525 [Lachnospiraceae bacterium]